MERDDRRFEFVELCSSKNDIQKDQEKPNKGYFQDRTVASQAKSDNVGQMGL